MKKLLSIIALTLFTSTQALASVPFGVTSTSYVDEPDFNIEVKIANNDNSIANLFNGYIDIMSELGSSEMNEKELKITNLFLDAIDGKNMQINAQNSGFWFQVEQSSSDFQEMLTEIEAVTSLKKEDSPAHSSYQFRFSELAFANLEGKLMISDSNETIFFHNEEVTSQSISLDNNQVLSASGDFDGNNFEYSLSEENGVLTATSSSNAPSSINRAEYNTTNHLYTELKSNNPAVYAEFTQALNMIKGLLGEQFSTEIDEELQFELGEDLPSYESIFNKQTAFLLDLNETIIPEVTVAMADITSVEASEILNLINDDFIDTLENSDFTFDKTDINSELKRVTITPTEQNLEADILDIEEIVITYGLYEGNFIITNNADVLTESQTLEDNSSFSNSFATSRSNVGAVSYIDFATISDQLSIYEETYSKLESESSNSTDLSDTQTILAEMGVWSGYNYIENDKIKEAATFVLPSDLLLEQLEKLSEESLDAYSYSYTPYTDVNEDSWYYEEVSQAYRMYIIDTYDYETETFSYDFQPGKDITRGEFIQMIIAAYELEYEEINQYGSDIFSDVDSSSYFDYAIGVAFEKGIIKGDDGANTFRPNETLNRAEATQILYNASPLLNGKTSTLNRFKDVQSDAWYANVVRVAAEEEIVKGINPEEFAPGKNLNKAEAVTLLIRLVNNEVRF